MLPKRSEVNNVKQMVLISQSADSAERILLNLFHSYLSDLQTQNPNSLIEHKLLTIIQAYSEFGLEWHRDFFLALNGLDIAQKKTFYDQIDFNAMQQKATKNVLRQIIYWRSCRKNPLHPTKAEVIDVIHQICHQSKVRNSYFFVHGPYAYHLYWQQDYWHLKNCQKNLVWHLNQ